MRSCIVWLHSMASPRWMEDAPDTAPPHLLRKDVHSQFQCFGKLQGGRSTIGTDVADNGETELWGRQVPTLRSRE